MTERPILFSDSMVRAILAGTKTQTRRVLTPQPHEESGPISVGRYHPIVVRRGLEEPGAERFGAHTDDASWSCPYGEPGDRLWVREAFALSQRDPDDYEVSMCEPWWWDPPVYRAGTADGEWTRWDGRRHVPIPPPWRPSIHMPRWASRLTLEVTSVRVERVQSISEEDARAEGVTPGAVGDVTCWRAFRVLWDSINGEREGCSWKANPWVWVVGFRRATPRLRERVTIPGAA